MTDNETAEMLADVVMHIGKLTDEYIENVVSMFETYPELRKLFGFVLLTGSSDNVYTGSIVGNADICKNLLMEGMKDVCTHRQSSTK